MANIKCLFLCSNFPHHHEEKNFYSYRKTQNSEKNGDDLANYENLCKNFPF